jgi:hypothetical protein
VADGQASDEVGKTDGPLKSVPAVQGGIKRLNPPSTDVLPPESVRGPYRLGRQMDPVSSDLVAGQGAIRRRLHSPHQPRTDHPRAMLDVVLIPLLFSTLGFAA